GKGLAGLRLELPRERPGARHVYHLYVVRTPRRAELAAFLKDRGVQTGVHYPVPTHRQPAVERFAPSPLPATERLVDEILTLPISDRKSTRLNSSHQIISYAVFCLKKKKNTSFYTKSNPINAQRLLARTPTTN